MFFVLIDIKMVKLTSIDRFTKLSFPSSLLKKFMISEIQNKKYTIGENNISVGNSHLILTKSIESLLSFIISEATIYLTKSNVGLYELHCKDIIDAIYKSPELSDNFLSIVLKYDKDVHYCVIDNKELLKFLDTIDNNIKIDIDAINFIQYLINRMICSFMKTAYYIMKEYNKIRINGTIIRICWNVIFVGKYHDRLIKEMEEMIGMIDDFREKNKEEKEEKKDGEGVEKKEVGEEGIEKREENNNEDKKDDKNEVKKE